MCFNVQYIPRNMHTVFALLFFVVLIHSLIFPYPSGLLHWHFDNLTIAPVSAKQPWWIWINTSCEFIMNDCITTTKQSTTKPCAYFLGYIVSETSATLPLRLCRILHDKKNHNSNDLIRKYHPKMYTIMNIYDFKERMKTLNTVTVKFRTQYYIHKKLFESIVNMTEMLWELSKQFVL